jgi:subtilisin-like proprotein convertase family protein
LLFSPASPGRYKGAVDMQRTILSVVVMGAALLFASAAALIVDWDNNADARSRFKIVTEQFSNTAPISIPSSTGASTATPSKASLYPSEINISGLKKGSIRNVNVKLNNFSHTFPDDVDVMLVGPTGQAVILQSDAGGGDVADDLTFTFDNEASDWLPNHDTLTSGTFLPTQQWDGSSDEHPDDYSFPSPAPELPPDDSDLSAIDYTDPNGTWELFVVDDFAGSDGKYAGGWTLEITARVRR